jgi:hypothetical protein
VNAGAAAAAYALGLALACVARATPAQSAEPTVTLVVHIVLAVPHLLRPAADAYCLGDTRPARSDPISSATLARYDTELATLGTEVDHFGFGTWTLGAPAAANVAFEPVDHVFVNARMETLARGLPPILSRMRRELHQQEVLAEIFASRPPLGEARTRLEVILPFARVRFDELRRIHAIFGDGGRSGASQYDAEDGVHVYSSVAASALPRTERALRAAKFAFRASPSRFVTDDAPVCARGSKGT